MWKIFWFSTPPCHVQQMVKLNTICHIHELFVFRWNCHLRTCSSIITFYTERKIQTRVVHTFSGNYIPIKVVIIINTLIGSTYRHRLSVGQYRTQTSSFGANLTQEIQPTIVTEKRNILKMPSFLLAAQSCIVCYYVFNIKFHPSSKSLCHILEYMCGLETVASKLPLSVQQVIHGLLKVPWLICGWSFLLWFLSFLCSLILLTKLLINQQWVFRWQCINALHNDTFKVSILHQRLTPLFSVPGTQFLLQCEEEGIRQL